VTYSGTQSYSRITRIKGRKTEENERNDDEEVAKRQAEKGSGIQEKLNNRDVMDI
jgi:hypothetical protein